MFLHDQELRQALLPAISGPGGKFRFRLLRPYDPRLCDFGERRKGVRRLRARSRRVRVCFL